MQWVSDKTATLHWSKGVEDTTHNRATSKYILLKKRDTPLDSSIGDCKGVATAISYTGKSILLTLEGGKSLDLKMDSAKAMGWIRVLKGLSGL
jgi:hypothetical protein